MKFNLLLSIFFFAPFVVMGQESKDSAKGKTKVAQDSLVVASVAGADSSSIMTGETRTVVDGKADDVAFLNIGAIYFAKKATPDQDLANGDEPKESAIVMAVYGDVASDGKKATMKMEDNSAMSLTGDIDNVFFDVSTTGFKNGAVWFANKTNNTAKFDLFHDEHPVANSEIDVTPKRKKLEETFNITQKVVSYSVLPNVVLGENAHVELAMNNHADRLTKHSGLVIGTVDGNDAVVVDKAGSAKGNGSLYLKKGSLFALKAKYSETKANELIIPTLAIGNNTNAYGKDASKGVKFEHDTEGQVLYELELYKQEATNPVPPRDPENPILPEAANESPIGSNYVDMAGIEYNQWNIQDAGIPVRLYPFVSPFSNEIGGDTFMFNTLVRPFARYIGGGATENPGGKPPHQQTPIISPTQGVKPNSPYFLGFDVSKFDHKGIEISQADPGMKISGHRYVGGYQFNRGHYLKAKGLRIDHMNASKFNNEIFKSINETVKIELTAGLNFIINGYMANYDVSELLDDNGGTFKKIDPDWHDNDPNINLYVSGKPGTQATIIADSRAICINPKLFLPINGAVQYMKVDEDHVWKDAYKYSIKYDVIQKSGATVSGASQWKKHIENMPPLSIFGIQVSHDIPTFQLPRKNIKLAKPEDDNVSTPRLALADDAVDELLFETTVLDSYGREIESMSDRLAIVLRENASFGGTKSDDNIDTRKLIDTYSVDVDSKELMKDSEVIEELNAVKRAQGILYTKSTDGTLLMASAVPTTAKEIPVYFNPTFTRRNIVIKPYKVESLTAVSQAWLVDHYNDDLTMEITPDLEYEFVSEPVSEEIASKNRFSIILGELPNESIVNEDLPIICRYNGSTLYIEQLQDIDVNSTVRIYDLQGRLMGSTKIKNTPIESYMKPLSLGTYLIRIVGERNYSTKLMVMPE